jgi:amidohydrolase
MGELRAKWPLLKKIRALPKISSSISREWRTVMARVLFTFVYGFVLLASNTWAQTKSSTWTSPSAEQVNAIYPEIESLYIDLHRSPELALHEQQTAAKLAERMKALGYEVTTGVGGTGVVAILRNGPGHTVLLRTDMDALPIEEKTGLPFASQVIIKSDAGASTPVMHACGHDIHMSSWYGTAKLMATNRDRWRGTLIFVGQPAEETGQGAPAMINDGLFSRFPKPDFALAVHNSAIQPVGQVGFTPGYALAAADSVDITIIGRGGHGGRPQNTIDPVVIAARTVLSLQTIVSREDNPFDPVVITVGTIHGGVKNSIIPDEVKLQLTVRTYKPEVRKRVLASIERVAKGEAMAGGAPQDPIVKVTPAANATYNDPVLTDRLVSSLRPVLGPANVLQIEPTMIFEDFAEFNLAGIPSADFWIGAVEPAKFAAAQKSGELLPQLHSATWVPDYAPTLKTTITVETTELLELLGH